MVVRFLGSDLVGFSNRCTAERYASPSGCLEARKKTIADIITSAAPWDFIGAFSGRTDSTILDYCASGSAG